ncbi:MAG: iron transporter [Magnetococcales bacterium]|nr:iron transporter [Magnetococcales bacterium]
MKRPLHWSAMMAGVAMLIPFSTQAAVMEIGKVETNGMKVAGIYIQSVVMEGHGDHHGGHAGHGDHQAPATARADSDIHLEAQIHALDKNPHGFAAGSWIPYLGIEYSLEKVGSDWKAKGVLIPMASGDGPHYGENVKLAGPGKYKVVYTISPPSIPYHVDKETGVSGWWTPFKQEWEFNYTGTGKKGGY